MKRSMIILGASLLSACGGSNSGGGSPAPLVGEDLRPQTLQNPTAYITSQCYTKTTDAQNRVYNPCFSCHTKAMEPNYINDEELQLSYAFPPAALKNPYTNLFKDRREAIARISDEAILNYVREDNYKTPSGGLILAEKLAQVPAGWDFNGDGQWDGYVPDCYFAFDNQGFDRTPSGGYTGWRAFGYYPFLGTFWPTNGSTDDVLIRLPDSLQKNAYGEFDLTTYLVNLAIVEALITRRDVPIEPVDEKQFGVDLDKNGSLSMASTVVFDWAPLEGRFMEYVGLGRGLQQAGKLHLAAGLYPEGTEFLHTVRYIDIDAAGQAVLAPRIKEVRYSRKLGWLDYNELRQLAQDETVESVQSPDNLKQVPGNVEDGVSNGVGWVLQGFIEDAQGALRPQTYEESVFCVGCHGGIGATTDSSFAFPRKLGFDAFQNGWYHWTQKGLAGVPERKRLDGEYDYSFYLQQNGAGDEFRENTEVMAKFFNPDGTLKAEAIERLHQDISYLLNPSPERALALNKAYKLIVEEQSYIYGRDATITPAVNVHQSVEPGQSTDILQPVVGY